MSLPATAAASHRGLIATSHESSPSMPSVPSVAGNAAAMWPESVTRSSTDYWQHLTNSTINEQIEWAWNERSKWGQKGYPVCKETIMAVKTYHLPYTKCHPGLQEAVLKAYVQNHIPLLVWALLYMSKFLSWRGWK